MRAVVVNRFGGPEAFALEQVAEPVPTGQQLLVRVAASGVNFLDVYQRRGGSPLSAPYTAGVEGVGVVEAVGADVVGLSAGQRVGWLTGGQGSFADLVAVAADKAVPLPDSIDDVTALAVLMQGVTAHYLATDTYPVQTGDPVLVHAAAGGVGLLLTQIVKLRGGLVIGTASSEAKAETARAVGADHVLGYDGFADAVRELTGGRGAAVVYDGVGATTFDGSLASLRPRGMLVLFGAASGPVPPFEVTRLAGGGSLFLTRPTVVHYTATGEELRARAADLFGWVASGAITVQEPTRYPLEQVRDAFEALESRGTSGKLVLLH